MKINILKLIFGSIYVHNLKTVSQSPLSKHFLFIEYAETATYMYIWLKLFRYATATGLSLKLRRFQLYLTSRWAERKLIIQIVLEYASKHIIPYPAKVYN
jgi:hypothetical protein